VRGGDDGCSSMVGCMWAIFSGFKKGYIVGLIKSRRVE